MGKNLTVGKKIFLGFASVLLLTAILGGFGVFQIRKVDSGVMDLADVHIPLAALTGEIDAAATGQNLQVSLYTLHHEDAQKEEVDAIVDGYCFWWSDSY